jgi:predicted regulator of Ras-like GTPase activity (Roadblock/LC7/MglB family)
MFERLKRLFRRRALDQYESEPPERSPADERPPVRAEAHPLPPSEVRSPGPDSIPSAPAGSELIQISLRSVVLKLPDTLKAKIKQPPAGGVRIAVPASKILPQLPQGIVRITFGELRKTSPPGVFSDASDRDHTLVDLPLQEILQQLKPDQLPRRLRQKRVEVPDEVVPIFSQQRGQSTVRISKPTHSEPPRPKSEPVAPHPTDRPGPATIKPSVPLPMPSTLRATPPAPAQPLPIRPSTPLPPLGPAGSPPAAPRPIANPPPSAPVLPLAPVSPPKPAAPKPAPAPTATTPSTSGSTEFITVPLSTVTMGWPEPIRNALAGLNAADATLNLPAEETEQALKRGKVVFSWKRLKPLVRPPLKTALAPALDELQLELPLPAIAPLFMAQRKNVPTQRKYDVGGDIPDVFSGRGLAAAHAPQPSRTPAPAPAAPAQPKAPPAAPAPMPPATPAPTPAPAPIPMPVAAKLTPAAAPSPAPAPASPASSAVPTEEEPRDIGEVFGQPGRKNWAPAEIVQRTATLNGIAGSVIAMQDGLLIAAQLPPGLNGDTIAAFLPQMYTRMMQYSKELKFGDSNNITFIIQRVPLRIYRVGGVYFAALGRADESLPETPLRLIASHLGPQSK